MTTLNLPQAEIIYYSRYYSEDESFKLFKRLLKETDWQHKNITLFGKSYPQPRLIAWYGFQGNTYSYSGLKLDPFPFTPMLIEIKTRLESFCGEDFNGVLLNLYRDGQDSNGWHSDDEKELGQYPVIASISLGANRVFKLKHKFNSSLKQELILENGSLLLMKGETQRFWKHQIPKSAKIKDPRINLTFRRIC